MIRHSKENVKKITSTDKSYIYFLTLISVPTLIVSIVLTGITIWDFTNSVTRNKNEALSVLSDSSSICENSLGTIITMTSFLSNNDLIVSALTDVDWQYNYEIENTLKNFKLSLSYIDSVYIYNKANGIVYSENGKYTDDDFFTEECSYNNYSANYWKNFMLYRAEPYRILSPSLFSSPNDGKSRSIIPIVICRINDLKQNNFLVVNVDIKNILHLPKNDVVEVFIYNKFTNEIFYPENYSAAKEGKLKDVDFLQDLSMHPNDSFSFCFDNEKTIVSTHSENDSIVGYTYFAVISLTKLIEKELPIIFAYIIIILIVFALSFYTTFHNTNKIYRPVKHAKETLDKMLPSETKKAKNIFEQIELLSENIQHTNNDVLSFAQEHYLVKMLNSTDDYSDKASMDILHSTFDFKYKYFTVVLIQIAPTSKFYDFYNQEVYFNIKRDFYEIVKDLFSQKFLTYVIPAENGVLDIILNFNNEKDHSMIAVIFDSIYKIIETDRECLNFSVGIGSICSEVINIKNSHNAAKYNFITYEQPNISAKILSDEQELINFNRNSEDVLFSALSSYDRKKINDAITLLFEKNNKLSGHSIKLLYNYIFNVILKFIRINNIAYKNDMLDYELLDSFLKQPVENIKTDLNNLIEIVLNSKKERKPNDDIAKEIMQYISKNFTVPDISIKDVSSKFFVSQSSVSRIIKDETGLGFRDFINMKRVEKAKNLLANNKKSIEEVYAICGFTNRQTFIRLFKSNVGQTPTEYKLQQKSKLHN